MPDDLLLMKVSDIIQRESIDWYSLTSKARLHKVGEEQARDLAKLVITSSGKHLVPLAFFLAVIRQESRFDPLAVNPNGNPGVLENTDYGIGQISGRNLKAMFPNKSDREIEAIVFDPIWGLETAAKTYRGLIEWARVTFPGRDDLYIATMAYNRGRTGASRIIKGEATDEERVKGEKHAERVMSAYKGFVKELPLKTGFGKYRAWEDLPEALRKRWEVVKGFAVRCFDRGMIVDILADQIKDVRESGYPWGGKSIYQRWTKSLVMTYDVAYGLAWEYRSYRGDIHELGHAVRFLLVRGLGIWKLGRLFGKAKKEGLFLDEYAASSMEEYFAQGFEAYFTEGESTTPIDHSRQELQEKDPDLFAFIANQEQG